MHSIFADMAADHQAKCRNTSLLCSAKKFDILALLLFNLSGFPNCMRRGRRAAWRRNQTRLDAAGVYSIASARSVSSQKKRLLYLVVSEFTMMTSLRNTSCVIIYRDYVKRWMTDIWNFLLFSSTNSVFMGIYINVYFRRISNRYRSIRETILA